MTQLKHSECFASTDSDMMMLFNLDPYLCADPVGVTEGRTVAQAAAPRQAGAGHRHHGPR